MSEILTIVFNSLDNFGVFFAGENMIWILIS